MVDKDRAVKIAFAQGFAAGKEATLNAEKFEDPDGHTDSSVNRAYNDGLEEGYRDAQAALEDMLAENAVSIGALVVEGFDRLVTLLGDHGVLPSGTVMTPPEEPHAHCPECGGIGHVVPPPEAG